MMTNKIRGEVPVTLGGEEFTLCLTLGALADIESGLGVKNLSEMDERLAQPSMGDLMVILCALLRGGGHDVKLEELAARSINLQEVVRAIESAFRLAMAPEGYTGSQQADAEDMGSPPGKS